MTQLRAGDRVRRVGGEGAPGTVKKIRIETIRQSVKESTEGPSVSVTVIWDNGTISDFVPEGLELVSAAGQ